ncbi:unnamed protein product [Nesidiocoris tenuis]|uniref:Uncharacterized protein n=1 Tax=Nesidiocoris tenuis TaxID=355587 RepID=A0A6H5G9C2_9HEMI|nr:unnamed protein product [Nesidiocoris tenuis]
MLGETRGCGDWRANPTVRIQFAHTAILRSVRGDFGKCLTTTSSCRSVFPSSTPITVTEDLPLKYDKKLWFSAAMALSQNPGQYGPMEVIKSGRGLTKTLNDSANMLADQRSGSPNFNRLLARIFLNCLRMSGLSKDRHHRIVQIVRLVNFPLDTVAWLQKSCKNAEKYDLRLCLENRTTFPQNGYPYCRNMNFGIFPLPSEKGREGTALQLDFSASGWSASYSPHKRISMSYGQVFSDLEGSKKLNNGHVQFVDYRTWIYDPLEPAKPEMRRYRAQNNNQSNTYCYRLSNWFMLLFPRPLSPSHLDPFTN